MHSWMIAAVVHSLGLLPSFSWTKDQRPRTIATPLVVQYLDTSCSKVVLFPGLIGKNIETLRFIILDDHYRVCVEKMLD